MSRSAKNIMVRVIENRILNGEKLPDVLEGYTKLTDEEKKELQISVEQRFKE